MTSVKTQVKNILDECLILVTGAQILLGFDYQGAFQTGFKEMPLFSQYLKIASQSFLLLTLALLLSPPAYHCIVEENRDNEAFLRYTKKVAMASLLPFALGLGLDLYVIIERITGALLAAVLGIIATLVTLFFWYGLEMVYRPGGERKKMELKKQEDSKQDQAGLTDKIDHLLTEIRVVLPGVQALLGFQLISVLTEAFGKLPPVLKYVHLAGLLMIALAGVLLLAPTAFHRIVEKGEDTERMLAFGSKIILWSLVPIALGLSTDLLLVVYRITESYLASVVTAGVALVFFYGFWFGYTFYRRRKRRIQLLLQPE